MSVIKRTKHIISITIFLLYIAATIMDSDFWGNILSPIVMFESFYFIYKAFFANETGRYQKIQGFFLAISVLFWAVSDALWAVSDLILHINPEESVLITYSYAMTNVFLTISLFIYGFKIFRKWNMVQILLDSAIISFFVIDLIWIAFLDEDVKNLMKLRSDFSTTMCIILDVLAITLIAIWYISLRNGKLPFFLRLLSSGIFLFTLADLTYSYQYFYSTYNPNSILDAVYITSFRLMAMGAMVRLKGTAESKYELNNTGRKGKGYFLFLAPIILIIFRGFDVSLLLQYVSIILIYNIFSTYIQKNIHKEGLLRKEQELNNVLEQKVKSRTEQLEEKNKELQQLLDQDSVTGLYNRDYLLSYLGKEIDSLEDDDTIVLLYIDINRFKMITTMYGHYIGDKVLREMAEKLKPMKNLAERSILASYGDDSYIFAAVGAYDYQNGHAFANEAIKLCSDIYRVEEYQIRVTVNIGISLFMKDARTKEEMIKHADIAMTQARMHGFNVVQVFDEKLGQSIYRKNTIEILLKKANFKMDFMVYYQPQLQTESKKLIGFEALLRWKTQTGELIGPSEFIPIAEETGYIIPIGDWVMKMVMQQIVEWNSRFEEKIMIGINVSLKQLNSNQFLERLQEEMQSLGIKPEWIDIEITESKHLHENRDALTMLEDIRKLGVTISIDDFGTGYSSLSYFKDLPADRIKLAKELIDYIHLDDFDYQLVKSIIMLSKAKGIRVIAEGVETVEQWEALKELKCDEVQGFLFGKPAPASEIEAVYGDALGRNYPKTGIA